MIRATYTVNRKVIAETEAKAWERFERAVVYFWQTLQQVLNKSAGPTRIKTRNGSRTIYSDVSKPGEPPRKRTGALQRNTVFNLDRKEGSARVGVRQNAIYGLFLELGTRRMQPRPWLLATLNKIKGRLKAILETR